MDREDHSRRRDNADRYSTQIWRRCGATDGAKKVGRGAIAQDGPGDMT
jgi:hypothetical protein